MTPHRSLRARIPLLAGVLWIVGALGGCSEADDGADGASATGADTSGGGFEIVAPVDTGIQATLDLGTTPKPDSDSATGTDSDIAVVDSDKPLLGTFGAPCSSNEDCDSAVCVPSAGGNVCSKQCESACPDGFKCTPKTSSSGDITYYCVPGNLSLCDPCTLNADCNDLNETANICIQHGNDGSYCGTFCGPGKPACPNNYVCEDQIDQESGKNSKQCVPKDGKLCSCSAKAAAQSKSTACFAKNFYGKCAGSRSCSAKGLGECTAQVPKAEECNGIDDDCNGKTDDFSSSAKCDKKNEFGACPGKVVECVAGNAICDAPEPTPETCNGKDDNCDGKTDEGLCEDGNPCTKGSCNSDGSCKQEPQNGIVCDDGSTCTNNDKCNGGACAGTGTIACDDNNPCTADNCDTASGCTHSPKDGACPDDGQACTQDICTGGKCEHPAQSEGGACPDDGQACTQDICTSGKCLHPPIADGGKCLDDGDVCSQDVCKAGKCVHPAVPDTTACADDGNACTSDQCQGGKCAHPPVNFTVPCADDANQCTADVCDKGGCTHQALGADKSCLDDGDPCTQDVCVTGKCGHPPATNASPCLDDGLFCTDDVCNSGKCSHPANTKPCTEDGNPCTLDICGQGICQHQAGNANAPCADDGNVCTKDLCQAGQCKHPYSSGNPCDDGNPCTLGDFCDGASGNCKQSAALKCNDNNGCTNDKCQAFQGCVFEVVDNVMCDDGNTCTTGDKCLGGKCIGAGTKTCDDGNACTNDDCTGGCKYTNNSNGCADDNNPCTQDVCASGACTHPAANNNLPCGGATGNPCVEGLCSAGKCNGVSQDGKVCNDQDACTSNDKCTGGVCKGQGFKNCSDGNPCTNDSCDQFGTCVHAPADNASCVAGSSACPEGKCVAGTCQSKSGVTCQAEYDVDLCSSVKVPGTCSANGKCVASKGQSGFSCPGCSGICLQCTIFGGIQLKYCLAF